MAPSRRALLASLPAAVTAVAGCTALSGNSGSPAAPTATGTPVPVGAPRDVGAATVTVTGAGTRTTVAHLVSEDTMGLTTADDRFVFVQVRVDGSERPEYDGFRLRSGGRSVTPSLRELRPAAQGLASVEDGQYHPGTDSGWVAFEVPAPLVADRATVALGDAEWQLPGRIIDQLNRPVPEWELLSFSVPQRVEQGERFDVSVRVRNVGAAHGTLEGGINVRGLNHPVYPYLLSVDVPGGESRAWHRQFEAPNEREPSHEAHFSLLTPAGNRSRTTTITAATATPE
jgi:hypothetical protein